MLAELGVEQTVVTFCFIHCHTDSSAGSRQPIVLDSLSRPARRGNDPPVGHLVLRDAPLQGIGCRQPLGAECMR